MIPQFVHGEMSRQHAEYYRGLRFLPLGVAGSDGKLWATVLSNPKTTAESDVLLSVVARVNPDDPFVRAVGSLADGARHFAGVGIDFTNRSRIKVAGVVDSATLDGDTLSLSLRADEHLGNCPKYITVRELRPLQRSPETTPLGRTLSPEAKALLGQASTVFIATRHSDTEPRESDMGFNHRGGPRGFVRVLEDDGGTHLVLPDYSGNRFYQSLGNVETDPVMGVAVPDFHSGALLQVSGRARNLFDAEAARVMPGASLVTLISVDEAFFTNGALDLELVGDEQLSPYNPKPRLLASESPSELEAPRVRARIVDIEKETTNISTFTFALPAPAELVPGGHAIFDFSERVERTYQHMNDRDPRSLNDDFVRSFTVSKVSPDRRQISITVKKAGVVSSFLHSLSSGAVEPVEVDLKGFGGTFTCFENGQPIPHMLWVAGGVGITPFLAMVRALRESGEPLPDIELAYSCRGDEIELVREMTDIRIRVFDSGAPAGAAFGGREIARRRVRASDFDDEALLDRATVFVCGPEGFMADVRSWLEPKLDPTRLRFESFDF